MVDFSLKNNLKVFWGILSLVIITLIFNFGSLGIQELIEKPNITKLNSIKTQLDKEKVEIDTLKNKLNELSSELDMNRGNVENDGSEEAIQEFNGKISLYSKYKVDYENKVLKYNNNIDTYNNLAKSTGNRVYVIPVVRP